MLLAVVFCCYFNVDVRSDGITLPNKLNVHAPEFTLNRDAQVQQTMGLYSANPQFLQHSKSSGNIQQQLQLAAAKRHAVQMANLAASRTIFVQHPLQLQQIATNLTMSPKSLSFANSSNGNTENVSIGCCFLLFPQKSSSILIAFLHFSFTEHS